MTDIAKLVLQADTRQLKAATRDLKGVSTQAQSTAVDVDSMAFKIGAGLKRLIGPLAIGGAIAGMAALSKSVINTADEMTKAAQSIGIGVEELSRLRYAADLSGVSFQGLQSSLNIMNRNLVNVTGGTNAATQALDSMGIQARNNDGSMKSSTAILKEMADVFQTMPDGAEKSALAMAVLGRSGADMIPLLNGGSDALAQLTDEADKFGIVIDAETGRKAEQFNDNLARLQGVMGGVALKISAELLPALVSLTDSLAENSGRLQSFTSDMIKAGRGVGFIIERAGSLAAELRNRLAPAYEYVARKMAEAGFGGGPSISGQNTTMDVVNALRSAARSIPLSSPMSGLSAEPSLSVGGGGSGGGGGSASVVRSIGDAARDAQRELDALQGSLSRVIGRLDPTRAAREAREEMRATLNEAFRAGLLSEDERRKYFAAALFDGPTGTLEDTLKTKVVIPMLETGKAVKNQTQVIADNFAQMSQRVTSSLQGLANSIKQGDFLGILSGVLNTFVQLGSMGVFGKSIQTNINAAPTNASTGANAPAGKPFLVGERGREVFVPGQSGQIRPINDNQRVHVTVGVDPSNGNITAFVNGQIAATAPAIAQAGAGMAQAQMAQSARRRVR